MRGDSFRGGLSGHGGRPDALWGMRAGRRFSADDLQLALLALLAERPHHGYELIKRVGEISSGFYTPSSGMVYPALAYLVDVGHAVADVQGAKKSYSLTEEGRGYLAAHQTEAERILSELERTGARMAQVRYLYESGDDEAEPGTPEDLMLARYTLKRAMVEARHASPAEARRIAAILRRAAAEIKGEKP